MNQKIGEPVTVNLVWDHRRRKTIAQQVMWGNREYRVLKVGLHHAYRTGKALYHVFSVAAEGVFFRLVLDTETLAWTLEEIVMG
jgi:hypothetical protein